MSFRDWLHQPLFGQKALTATPAVLETLTARQFSPYVSLGGTNLNAQNIGSAYVKVQNASYGWVYLYSPPVRRAVDYIAHNVAQLGLKLYERVSDDEREHKGDHPASELLRRPNPQITGNYFIQEFIKAHLVFGNAYALKLRDNRGNLSLVLLPPGRVGIVGQSFFFPEKYRFWRTDGTFFDIEPENVIHWPATTGDDPRHGESYLETLREPLAAAAAAQTAVTELHKSGLTLPGWLERPLEAPPITPEALGRLQESVANQMKGAKRHPPIFEEGMAYKQGGVTPEDAQFIESRKLTFTEVASLYGMKNVPPEGEEERRQFYADVLPPLCEMCASSLDLHILQREFDQDDYYFEFNLDEKLMSDDRLKTLTSAAGVPIYTRNEARARLNLPALPGGDELAFPANIFFGSPPKPSTGVMPIQDPNKPPQDGSHRTEDVPVPAGRSLNGHKKLLHPVYERANQRRNGWGKRYEDIVARHFNRQRNALKSAKKALTDERWNTELADDLNGNYLKQFTSEGEIWAFRMASEFDPEQGKNYLKAKAVGAAEEINRTTQEHVAKEGVDGAFEKALVRAVGAGAAMATSVASFATKTALEQAPGESRVVIDGGDCDQCAPYQGDWGVEELDAWPAYHPSCGCVAVPYTRKSAQSETKVVDTLATALVKAYELNGHNGNGNGLEALAKAIPALAKAISEQKPAQITVQPAETHIHEGAMKTENHIEASPPAEMKFEKGAFQHDSHINVEAAEPANVTIEEGAINAPVTVEPSPAPEVNFAEGAMTVNVAPAEVTVEPSPPAEVNVHPPDVKVDVEGPHINVDAPPPAEVNVTTPAVENHIHVPKEGGKRKVTFSDGTEAKIEETDE